eukprot:Blabericola_migrator_1__9201@NODE_492_length_8066_cov_115_569946_g377_i0_p6_GENE_NODE_492_length_8066_cov_115_569946_g377_i0NODE_492_length_8066_cov_115_569946_g377_i0_p6_ORF_typecomplete_len154_score43_39Striatin/PF08232_12/3_8_NODE_492_length_8066_cov_115_569946_g377_i073627823
MLRQLLRQERKRRKGEQEDDDSDEGQPAKSRRIDDTTSGILKKPKTDPPAKQKSVEFNETVVVHRFEIEDSFEPSPSKGWKILEEQIAEEEEDDDTEVEDPGPQGSDESPNKSEDAFKSFLNEVETLMGTPQDLLERYTSELKQELSAGELAT